ncbi:MAG: TIGR01777 family oxidoreductase [Ginsengibacter sp.]
MPVVLISGGSGLIGTNLTRHLIERNYEVIILSRNKEKVSKKPKISYAHWDIKSEQVDEIAIRKATHIVHLAGAGVMEKRWREKYKNEIVESRTKSADLLIRSLQKLNHKVECFVSASAIGWYGEDPAPFKRSEGFIESDPPEDSFLGETCRLWEGSVSPVEDMGIRLVKLRTGIVLSNDGGAYKEYVGPLKFGIAPILGGGKQVVSWIHIEDICRMYIYALENTEMEGSYNAVAPHPVSQKKLILEAADAIKNKFYIPVHVPPFLLKLALGDRSTEVLKSATVSDIKIKLSGFTFLYPSLQAAINELTKKNNSAS